MSAEVGQQNTPVPGDNCDVTTIQDEDLLRKMWQTTDDFGRKKEIRARMYKLREARLREFYTTGEVLKDVQSVDPTAVSVSIREETPKRGGTHYRQLVVGELRGDVESSATVTTHYETTTTTGGTVTKQRTEEVKTLHNNGAEVIESSKSSSSSSRLPRLNVSTRCSETTQDNKMSSSSNDNRISTERQTSNTDTKIMSELQKLDTFLSTTGVDTPTPTPDSIRSSAFDGNNWTVVSTNTKSEEASKAIKDNNATVQEFVFESGEGDGPRSKTVIAEYHQPGSETAPEVHAVMKQTASHAQYSSEDGSSSVTRSSKTTSSYSVSHQQRRISSDNSLAHEAFARSLRSPERRMYDSNTSTRTSSKSSLDASIGRGSPERAASTRSPRPSVTEQRNVRSSPRSSPEKERSAPSSPTRFSRGSPTRANPDKARVSPTRDTVDKCSPVRSSPERKFSRESPEKISPTRETTERRVYQSSTSTTSTSRRRTSQTSPQRQSPTRETPQRKNSQPSSPKKEESERRVSQTRRPSTKDEPQRRNSQVKSESPARASPEKDRASSPEKSPSPTRFSTSSTTRLTSSSVSKRKLSSASSRASAKRAGTPGASPNASPTRADTRDDKTQESSSEDESQDEIFISGQQKQTSEVLNVSAEEDSTQVSEVLSHTLLTSAMNESLSTSMKTNSLSEISTTKTTDVEISGSNTLPRKKSSIKEPLSPQITPQTSPETVKKSPENEISGTGTLPRKKSSLKSPSTPQTTPQTTPQSSPESKSDRPTDFRSTLKNFEMRSSPVTTPDKPRSILRQDHSPKPSKSTPSPSEPDDSSRSLKSGTVDVLNVMSVVEQQLEMTPCEEVVESARAEPIVPVTPVTRKNTVQERTARRRSRDYVSDEDTSERDSSSSPIRKHPSRQQPAPKTVQKTPVSASPQRPTKLPVASNKHDTGINSPDRCCGRQHGDHDKPWRQSPASSPVSFKRKPLNSTASPVSSPERKPTTPQRRRPASRSPSTSPDRPHEATTRPGRKSPPQKSAQSSPRTPPGKHVTPAASPARRVESPAGKRQITERTSSGGRLRGPTDTQRTSNLAKPSARGPSSPTKVDSPVGRGVKSPTKGRPAVVDDGDESPPQEFRVEETSEDEVARKVCTTSRIATSTSRRADVVRKVQGSPTSPTKPGARTQPSRVPANTTSRVPRVEPVAQRPSSRVPTATSQPQKKLSDTAKPRPTRTDSDKSIGCKRSVTSTATVNKVTKTAAKTVEAQKTIGVRKQTNNVSQISSRFTSTNTTASKLQRPQATTSKKSGVPTLKVPAGKPVQNGHTPGPVESEDEVESTFSTEEDETVTELEEVRYSSHTVDDTEDEDFKTRVNTCGASLKVGTTDIVQLRSSRDSSPENRPQRFADHISEPESDFDTRKREPTPLEVVIKPEQITDLDEENEVEPSLLSVADRVSRFLTPGTLALLQSEKKKMQINETNKSATLDSPNAVRRARAMFETIANAPSEPVPKQTVPDILSRPSIFDSPTRGRSPVPVTSVKKNIQSFEQETVEQEHILVSESEEDKYKTKVTEDESKFNTYNKKQTDDDAKYNTYKKEPIVDEIQTKEPVKMDEAPRKTSVCDESITTESKFVSTATLTTSRKQSEEKPRAVVAPRQESPVRTKDGATKQKPTEQKPTSGGKFGVTLRKTPSTVRMESKTVEQTKTTSTTTTVIEGIVIEETTDIKLLEQMMEKATDYDERRRLRAQIREVRRLGPAAAATPARKASSPTRQVKPSESERRPSNTTRVPETSRQSPTRRSSSPTKPMNEEVTRKTSGAISPTRQEPTRKSSGATSPTRQEPTRKSSGATSPTRQEPTRKSSGATSPTHQEPTRKSSGATSPTRQEPTRKSSGATSPTRRAPKDEEDGNRMSSTFIRQASKKFEDEARKSSTSTIKKDESKFSTFTRQSSGKKVVTEDESRFNTFTRTSSSKKIESEEVPSTQRKSSKSEITIELAKPTTTTAASTRKPSVPSVVPGVPREAETACSVTSSYGVGPTDENGRPLFGLRALRRSQQQEPGSVVLEQPASDKPDAAEVKDTSGRPLFGLRAIKREGSPRSSDPSPAREQSPAPRDEAPEEEVSPKSHTMPERAPSNGQLRDLVTKHEQRGSPDSGSSPPQKPRAKLRDSFITTPQQSRDSNALKSKEEALTSRTQRSSALRAIIQKHESITDSEQTSKSIRKDSVRTDKSQYSVTVDSAREASPSLDNDAERASPRPPTDEATRRPSSTAPPEQVKRGILKKPRDSPERSAINHTSTTTTAVSSATINLRRVDDASVNKIIEDSRKRSSASRSPPDGSTNSSFELESPRAVAEQLRSTSSVQLEKSRISPEHNFDEEKVIVDEDGGETRVRTTHREEVDGNSSKSFSSRTTVTQRTSPRGAEERFSTSTSTTVRTSSSRGSPRAESPSKDPAAHSMARVGRSGSVKALQQRFQQAAAGSTENKTRGYQKAGLIFRTNSFQHTNGCGPQGDKSKEGSPKRDDSFDSEGEGSPSTTRRISNSEGRTSVSMEVNLSGCTSSPSPTSKSFLGNETRVTGVQDILTRMREADNQEVVAGETEEDREARSLLNKFLGAQVLLQGMEPLVNAQSPGLVSQVERQRLVVSTSSTGKEELSTKSSVDDLENIWDEKQLKQLLDACEDYDTRRKIRARLRVVMAENKVTSGSEVREFESTPGGGEAVMSSVREQSESTVITSADSSSRTEVQTKTSSFSSSVSTSSRVSKAALPSKLQMSPFAKFKQLDEKNSSPSPSSPKTPGGSTTPLFKFTDPGLTRSASNVKERLLYWCQVKTKEYKDLKIENFSTSWSDGMAFCALIHHFGPENFNYNILSPEKRRKNFELAFKVAEEKFDIAPLLDVDDMVMMKKPDWKCVFTYVQSIYRRFKDELD